MKKYDNYKDSGIEWIGEIPSHWELSKSKFEINVINGFAFKSEDFEDEGTPVIRIGDLKPPYVDLSNAKCIDTTKYKDLKPYSIIHGDLLLAMTGATIGKTATYVNDEISYLNQRVGLIKPLKNNNSGFTKYIYDSYFFREFVNLECSGSAQENIGKSQLGELKIAVPNSDEQNAIANYLDHKTTQIDHLIAKKEQFIQLLEEERVAVINQAVTKGLDTNVSMKDSGIEWLGEIPEHWEVKRIKHTTYVKGRIGWKGLRSDEFLEFSDSYVVTGTDFDNGNVKWDTCYQVPLDRYEDDPFIKLKNNDLLITKDGTIGKIAIVKDMPKIATLNSGVFLTRPKNNEYLQEYMYWILYSDVFKTFYDYNKSGSTIQHLYQNVFNEFKYTLPSLKEQTEIVKYLDKKNVEINQIKHKAQHEIELLKEYKTALISEVVTGKLDVRNEKLN